MSPFAARTDTFLVGYCDDARALLAHLDAETPWRAASLCVLDPDPVIAHTLRGNGVNGAAVDLRDDAALRAAGLEEARTIVVFAERVGGSVHELERLIRAVSPRAQVLVVPAGSGAPSPSLPGPFPSALRVVGSWRFWALIGVTLVDGLTFMIPLTPLLLLALALAGPKRLRAAARFFDDLAEAR